jgi:hypothetical protein
MAIPKRAIATLLLAFFGFVQDAISRELFEGSKVPTFSRGQSIFADDQVGGYQIYGGTNAWSFEDAKVDYSGGGASSIPLGYLRMTFWEDGEIAAIQTVLANLAANSGAYWSGSPCDGESIAKRNRSRGRYDDCMTIKVESFPVGSKQETFLVVNTVQSQSGGRYYIGTVGVNVAYLGFPGSTALQWNKFAVQSDSAKKSGLAKLTSWAESYQDAAAAQMDYRRPADTFSSVPKLRELKVLETAPVTIQKPATSANKGVVYVFCESTKSMVVEGGIDCPSQPTPVADSTVKTIEKRLQELKDLLGKGLIDKDAYQRKRDEILKSL